MGLYKLLTFLVVPGLVEDLQSGWLVLVDKLEGLSASLYKNAGC